MGAAFSPAQQITFAGQALQFTCPSGITNPAGAVILNKSSYELNFLNWLIPAWTYYPVDLAAVLGGATIIPLTSLLAPGVNVTGTAVYVQWLDAGEQLPALQAFTADAISAAITADLITQTTSSSSSTINKAADGATVAFVAAPPAGFENIFTTLYFATNLGGIAQYLISGHTTGRQLSSTDIPVSGSVTGPMWVNMDLTVTEGLDLFLPAVGGNCGFLAMFRQVAIPI